MRGWSAIGILGVLGLLTFCAPKQSRHTRDTNAIIAPTPAPSSPATTTIQPTPPVNPGTGKRYTDEGLEQDIVRYAQFCKQELGLEDKTLAPFNCLDGVEVPFTIDGERPTADNYRQLSDGKIGCDTPSWLPGAGCMNYSFLVRRTLSPDVEAVLLCRTKKFTNYKTKEGRLADYKNRASEANFRLLYEFDSLGLIWANKKNGNTCYFDHVGSVYGGYVPSPDDVEAPTWEKLPEPKPPQSLQKGSGESQWKIKSVTLWKPPAEVASGDNCTFCHDSGPWKRSPWLSKIPQVVPEHPRNANYNVVGKVFAPWMAAAAFKAITTADITQADGSKEPQSCTNCHHIGGQATCHNMVDFATGDKAPARLTTLGRKFDHRVWMPPQPADWANLSDSEKTTRWEQKYRKHVAAIKCCCEDPTAKGCFRQTLNGTTLAAPVEGKGPKTCL